VLFSALCLYLCIHRRCKDICSTRLTEGVISPYNSIRELQQYASSLVKSEPRAPNITLSADVQTFAIHGKHLHLPTLRAGLRKLFDDVSGLIEEVLLHQDIPITIPANLADDMSNTRRGYSWLDNGTFTEKQYPMLEGYLNDPDQRLCWKGRDGLLHFNAAASSALMKKTAAINRGISVLNDIVNSLPARGTEFVDHKIRNSWRRRSTYRDQGRLRWVNQYSKKTNGRKMDTFLPLLVADELQVCQEQYMILIRPVEELIARELWGEEARVLYHEYMYVEMGQRVDADMFSRHLRAYLDKYIGADLGIEELRQLSVSVMREFIPAKSHYMVMDNNVGDLIQDHSTNTSRGNYGGLEGSMPYLTTDAMFKYDDFCTRWHCITGFGKYPAPPPLRLVQSAGQQMYTAPTMVASTSGSGSTTHGASSGPIMQMMQLLLAKVTNLEAKMDLQAASTSTTLQEFRVQTKDDIRNGLAECFAVYEGKPLAQAPIIYDGPMDLDEPVINQRSPSPELEYGPLVDVSLDSIRLLLKQPEAEYRSENQKMTIQHCLEMTSNVVSVMGTGEGKSMAWQVPARLQPHIKNVVIISSAANLVNQYQRAKDMGLKAHLFRFSDNKGPSAPFASFEENNLIFVGMETAGDRRFYK
jgi:hypothetical protein